MEKTIAIEITEIVADKAIASEASAITELTSLELTLVGGGTANVVFL